MSILMDLLEEELDRLDRQKAAYEADLKQLPKGYISKKNIRGKVSYYLQHRDGQQIKSKYISEKDLPSLEEKIQRSKQLQASLVRVKQDQAKLRKVLKVKNERCI